MIRADEIEKRTLAADKSLIERGEQYIDRKLAEEYQPNGEVVVGLSTDYPSRVANHLAEMYRSAGWHVTVTSGDQRDPGFFLRFAKAGQSDSHYDK